MRILVLIPVFFNIGHFLPCSSDFLSLSLLFSQFHSIMPRRMGIYPQNPVSRPLFFCFFSPSSFSDSAKRPCLCMQFFLKGDFCFSFSSSLFFFSRMTSCIEVMTWSHQFGFLGVFEFRYACMRSSCRCLGPNVVQGSHGVS